MILCADCRKPIGDATSVRRWYCRDCKRKRKLDCEKKKKNRMVEKNVE